MVFCRFAADLNPLLRKGLVKPAPKITANFHRVDFPQKNYKKILSTTGRHKKSRLEFLPTDISLSYCFLHVLVHHFLLLPVQRIRNLFDDDVINRNQEDADGRRAKAAADDGDAHAVS